MRVGVLGTGVVGRAIAAKCAELEHDVVIGTRDIDALMSLTEPDARGNESFRAWIDEHPQVRLATFADAAGHGEMVVNATNGAASIDALRAAGEHNLDGKVLIDVANPLDFSRGMPPSLLVSNTDSLAEQIQRAFPGLRVVKTLNTVNARVMVEPGEVASGEHTIFVSGDDDGAKSEVADLLRSFGWTDIIDLGDISTARGAEMYLPLWVRLMGTVGGPMFNIKVVRE